ncbi:unnamed protein product [Peronospora belbahrii]|uniref:Sec1 family domain-containing protein 2 n=1 Tax=Peronospora belbahrii TaxID=622444 RepID=A0AAU9LG48_9STRA|nr:unnamed protein product [Peronospora belbahrii]CAH0515384.1 unnamed protein product [Peronospora belbahrii]
MVVSLAEEVLSGVLQAAEQLQGAVVAAETSCTESLRWSGALPLLLRDLGVQNVLQAEDLLSCETPEMLRRLLSVQDVNKKVCHVALMLSGFLWDYETLLQRLLALGVVSRLTICSSLSERAHECYDFSKAGQDATTVATGARADKVMNFEDFAQELNQNAMFPMENRAKATKEERWGWDDTETETLAAVRDVQIIHLPLNVVPLLSTKPFSPEPSVFVVAQPTCAAAFPLLLHQVKKIKMTSLLSPTEQGGSTLNPVEGGNMYAHVKDVLPEHIPTPFRRSMRLLAYTLAEMMVGARMDVKERIFAVGATSLKIGHTLLHILNESKEEATSAARQDQQAASMVIVDRTSDLATPCSFGGSLLDRILALLPQTPTKSTAGEKTAAPSAKSKTREKLSVTDIFPLHGCEPTPLSISAPLAAAFDEFKYLPSKFVSQIKWKGGASLCHPTIPHGSNGFRFLAFRPAKLALRDLDKRLQAVEQDLLQQGIIHKTAVTRKHGEKIRGRDVVLRRISKILEAGEPTDLEHSSLIELGVIVLETLERMDQSQKRWDECRKRVMRQLELRKQGGCEWILPEVVDVMQRQMSPVQSGTSPTDKETMSLQDLLTLLVNAFALSFDAPLEDFTIQMVQKALVQTIMQSVKANPLSVQSALPKLFDRLSFYVGTNGSREHVGLDDINTEVDAAEGDDWDWVDSSKSPTALIDTSTSHNDDDIQLIEAMSVVETYVEHLMSPLKDCGQQYTKVNDEDATLKDADFSLIPNSLITQLCRSIVDPSGVPITEIQHVVDASEQLTRAGIDLLRSGFSKFGFGLGDGSAGDYRSTSTNRLLGDSNIIVVFVVGGITFEEIQEVHDALSENTKGSGTEGCGRNGVFSCENWNHEVAPRFLDKGQQCKEAGVRPMAWLSF